MFQSARIKLTAWYVLLIMLITVVFSAAFYQVSTREIQRFIMRIKFEEQQNSVLNAPRLMLFRREGAPTIEELQQLKQRSLMALVIINGGIFLFSSVASYFLAGKTLRPIKDMIDEQQDFISNASHELRTPLATLRAEMEASLLEKNITDKEARHLIKSNLEEIDTLQELSDNLLRLTQLHSLSAELEMSDVSIRKVVKVAKQKIEPLAKQKQIEIMTTVADSLVRANASRLIEALLIILDNAVKYSPIGSTITIISTTSDTDLTLAIADQGVGIDEADLPHIFKRFYRADKSRSQADGYGLGLSIAQAIITAHSGHISVESQLGHGSTFAIHLPF